MTFYPSNSCDFLTLIPRYVPYFEYKATIEDTAHLRQSKQIVPVEFLLNSYAILT